MLINAIMQIIPSRALKGLFFFSSGALWTAKAPQQSWVQDGAAAAAENRAVAPATLPGSLMQGSLHFPPLLSCCLSQPMDSRRV